MPGQGPKDRRYWLAQRDVGYELAIKEAGLESIPPQVVYDPSYKESGDTKQEFEFRSRVMAGYLVEYLQGPEPIDAIMAASDGMIGYLSRRAPRSRQGTESRCLARRLRQHVGRPRRAPMGTAGPRGHGR